MAVEICPDRKQVRGLQSAKSTQSLSCVCLASAKSRIGEMLISVSQGKPSKSAVSSKMILSHSHGDLSL